MLLSPWSEPFLKWHGSFGPFEGPCVSAFSRHVQELGDLGRGARWRQSLKRFVKGNIELLVAGTIALRSRADDDHHLALGGRSIGVALRELGQRAGHAFLVKLADFANDSSIAAAEQPLERRQRCCKARPTLINDQSRPHCRNLGDRIAAGLGLCRKEAEEQEAIGRKTRQGQCCDRRGGPGNGMDRTAGFARGSNQLVARVRDQGRSCVADQRDGLLAKLPDNPRTLLFARMIVIAAHRHFGADVIEELCGYSSIFREDPVHSAKGLRGAWAKVAKIADWRCNNVQ